MIFFPIFSFIIGHLTGLGASIAPSHSVYSYIWFFTFMIYYSNLSLKSHRVFLILSCVPLLLSHEMMSYVVWSLIFLCFLKMKLQKNNEFKNLIKVIISFLTLTFLVSIFFIIFVTKSESHNRSEFFKSLFYMEFFIKIKKSY